MDRTLYDCFYIDIGNAEGVFSCREIISAHNVNSLDAFPIEPGAFYVIDRGRLDYAGLNSISLAAGFFATRSPSPCSVKRIMKNIFGCHILKR